jgi:hypothetical protein
MYCELRTMEPPEKSSIEGEVKSMGELSIAVWFRQLEYRQRGNRRNRPALLSLAGD